MVVLFAGAVGRVTATFPADASTPAYSPLAPVCADVYTVADGTSAATAAAGWGDTFPEPSVVSTYPAAAPVGVTRGGVPCRLRVLDIEAPDSGTMLSAPEPAATMADSLSVTCCCCPLRMILRAVTAPIL